MSTPGETATAPGYGVDCKYGKVHVELGQFHPDEPVFVLRAQDMIAPYAIDEYARLCSGVAECSGEFIVKIREAAKRMREWQKAHSGLTKKPD